MYNRDPVHDLGSHYTLIVPARELGGGTATQDGDGLLFVSRRPCPVTLWFAGRWHWCSLDAGHLFPLDFQARVGVFRPIQEHV